MVQVIPKNKLSMIWAYLQRITALRRLKRTLVFSSLIILVSTFSSIAFHSNKLHDTMAERYGEDGTNLLKAWVRMIDTQRQAPTQSKIIAVNAFFNTRIQFGNDIILWKQKDYWATPLETMGIRGGDCEDFTIAKYISLLELGIPKDQLRLIYVRASINASTGNRVQAHMVLGYYKTPTAIPLILDNINHEVKIASSRTDLKPVFSFNDQGLWVGGNRQSKTDPTSRLSHWRDVLQRIKQEGF